MSSINKTALFTLSYGLFVLSANENGKDNACIINTAQMVTDTPVRITVAVNKQNYTHDMIVNTGRFNISVISQKAEFDLFTHFGFSSGRDTDKFAAFSDIKRSENGLVYVTKGTNAYISAEVETTLDCGTHTLFIAKVTEAEKISDDESATYDYYFKHIKPAPVKKETQAKVWVCKICGYEYDESKEGIPFEQLPEDWVCLWCKHPKSDFELKQ